MIHSHEMTATCPHCAEVFPLASNVTGDGRQKPVAGDAALCAKCGEWSIYTRAGKLRKPTDKESQYIFASKKHSRLRLAWLFSQPMVRQ